MTGKVTSKILILLLAVLSCACSWGSLQAAAPSDTELLEEFRSHRGEFEKLRQLVTEDMHQRAFFSDATISNLLPEARRNEYRKLLSMSPNLAVGVDYGGTIRFLFSSNERLAIDQGWAKGIQFVPEGAKLVGTSLDSLDHVAKLSPGVYLREIEPRWFIFYQQDD